MRIKICLSLIAVFLFSYAFAETNNHNIFPLNNGTSVNDFAKLLNPEDTKKIKSLCEKIKKDELAVIVIATIDSIPKVKKEYENVIIYGTDLSNYWGIGRKGINDGVLFLISKKDRKTAICTGYLTEHYLPDSEAKKILDKYMIPNFKKGDYGIGIIAGIIEARKVMEKNRKFMYPEKYGENKFGETAADWLHKSDALLTGNKYTDPIKAIEYLNNAIKLQPNIAEAYSNRGVAYNGLGQYQRAIEDFNKAISLKPDYFMAYNNRGNAYDKLSQYQRAIEDFNKTIRLQPDYSEAYSNRGVAYYNLGQYQRAIEDFNKAISLQQNNAETYYNNRGNAYDKLGQYQRAIEDFNKAISLQPDYSDACLNRGNAYNNLGQYQRAIEDYNKAISFKPDYAQAFRNQGDAYTKLGQYQHAIEDYNKAISLKPNYVDAYNGRGNAYTKLGQYQRAIEDLNKAISLKPDCFEAYTNRGIAYLMQGNEKLGCLDAQKSCHLGNCKLSEMTKNKGLCH